MTPILMIAAGLFGAYLVLWPTGTDQTKLEIFLSALGAKDPNKPDTSASEGLGTALQGLVDSIKGVGQTAANVVRDPISTLDPSGTQARRAAEPWGQGGGGSAGSGPSSGFSGDSGASSPGVLPRSNTEGIPVADDAAGANRWGLVP